MSDLVTLSLRAFSLLVPTSWQGWGLRAGLAAAAGPVGLGPPAAHILHGSTQALMRAPNGSLQSTWFATYGSTVRYRTLFGHYYLLTMDPLAVSYIHRHADVFLQPDGTRRFSVQTMGPSLTAMEGAEHKRQRRAIAPSFGPAQIRYMTPTLFEKASELVKVVRQRAKEDANGQVDMVKYINQLTVDVIGAVAFDTDIGALKGQASELLDAWRRMMMGNTSSGFWTVMQRAGVPFTELLRTERTEGIEKASDAMRRLGRRLIAEKKAAIQRELVSEKLQQEDFAGHDLITNLLRLNMSVDVKPEQRMSDEELFAGNTTVAVSLAWAVGMLAKHPDKQERLRREVMELVSSPDWETLNALPYLEAFTHEVLRLYPAAPTNFRVNNQSVNLPLASPVVDARGNVVDSVYLRKGSTVHVAYGNMNLATAVFGPDAAEFRPERFLDAPGPSSWENTQTFGGGARNCIGSRLAVAEIKATLFTLVRSLTFAEIPSKPDFVRFGGLGLVRPKVGGKMEMPLRVGAIQEE